MKKSVSISLCISLMAATFLIMCGKKKQRFIVVDTDTITVNGLAPYSLYDSATTLTPEKMKMLGLMISLARQCPERKHADTVVMQEVVNDFTDQLSRESGREWTHEAAKNLYYASQSIKHSLDTKADLQKIQSHLDSLGKKVVVSESAAPVSLSFDTTIDFTDTTVTGRKMQLATLLASLFHVESHLSNVIAEFFYSETTSQLSQLAIDDLVKGLLYDSTAHVADKKVAEKKAPVQRDNSALALKFRSRQSIQNTISAHIPTIKAIYKKELKKNTNIGGIVYVTFRVSAAGDVLSARIKSSEIADRDFINPFLDYVKKITFKPIPENVGAMTFDFPFEFRPEL